MEEQGSAGERTGPFLNVQQATAYAHCSRRRLVQAMSDGTLWSFKPNRLRLTTTTDLDAWLFALAEERAA
jgi:hypothetical protein